MINTNIEYIKGGGVSNSPHPASENTNAGDTKPLGGNTVAGMQLIYSLLCCYTEILIISHERIQSSYKTDT